MKMIAVPSSYKRKRNRAVRERALGERLKKFKECQALPETELDALTNFVSVMGFMFGFMRLALLRQDREHASRMATAIAKVLGRAFKSNDLSSNLSSNQSYSSD